RRRPANAAISVIGDTGTAGRMNAAYRRNDQSTPQSVDVRSDPVFSKTLGHTGSWIGAVRGRGGPTGNSSARMMRPPRVVELSWLLHSHFHMLSILVGVLRVRKRSPVE